MIKCKYLHSSWGSPCPSSRVSPYALSVLICCIRLLYDWSCLSSHNLHLLFSCLVSNITLIWLVLQSFQRSDKIYAFVRILAYIYFHSAWTAKSCKVLILFLWIKRTSSRQNEIRERVCISKSHKMLFFFISSVLCLNHLFVLTNFQSRHNFLSKPFSKPAYTLVFNFFRLIGCIHL